MQDSGTRREREQSRGATVRRRLRSVPPMYIAFVVVSILLVPLLLVALVVDIARIVVVGPKFVAVRLTLFLWIFLLAETVGITVLFLVWCVSRGPRLIDRTFAVQRWWTGLLWNALRRLFALNVVVEGEPGPAPVIVLIRHASLIDNLIPANFIPGVRLRYVIKRELLAEPCLDIAGSRLPNVFVARESGGDERELNAVRALARDLGPRDGLLIYPEGTRFSQERLDRSRAKLREAGREDLAAKADHLTHLLPPRVGGPLALLDAAPEPDILILGHTGLDGVTYIRNIWAGRLNGATIAVRMQRHARADLPTGDDARIAWIYDRWLEMDAWISGQD